MIILNAFLSGFNALIKPKAAMLLFSTSLMMMACSSDISTDSPVVAVENVAAQEGVDTKFVMTIFGAIHSGHRNSSKYSLAKMEQAVRNFKPDTIFIEIPPASLAQAQSSFDKFGEVRERRTRAFPELTDVVFPLQKELGYNLVATAGWSRQIANKRGAVLKRIENDPARQTQWKAHTSARAKMRRLQRGKSDDPFYIHTAQYDAEVKEAQTPYETYFDAEIGAGGWGPINKAHVALMKQGLDNIKTDAPAHRVLIIFGAWHKYKILEAMENHDDVTLVDAKAFFGDK